MNQVDFTPQWYRVRLQSARDRKKRLGYLGVICLLMIGWFLVDWGRIRVAQAALDNTKRDHGQVMDIQERVGNIASQKRRLEYLIRRFGSVASGIDKSIIFIEISHRIPDQVRLADFKMTTINAGAEAPDTGRRRRSIARSYLPPDVRYSDLKITFRAQAEDNQDFTGFHLELEDSSLFEKVDPEGTKVVKVSKQLVFEKKFHLYVYRKEHFGP